MSRPLLIIILAAANATLAISVWTQQPWANGPAEWRWEYLARAGATGRGPRAGAEPEGERAAAGHFAGQGGGLKGARTGAREAAGARGLVGPAALTALVALAGLGIGLGHPRLAASRGAPLLAVACGAAFTFSLVAAQPGGLSRVTAALVSRNSFGYVWDAGLAPSTRALLADYPTASANLNQHSLAHPPGPLLAVRALAWLDRVLPAPTVDGQLGTVSANSLPGLAAAAIDREMSLARSHGRPVPEPPPGPWVVAALAVLLPTLSALAAWPLFLLARRWGLGQQGALLATALWLLVPARSLFTPSFDQALPALLVSAAWLAAEGGRWREVVAGVLLFAACFLTYGCLPVLPLVLACVAAGPAVGNLDAAARETSGAVATQPSRIWRRWLPLALGFALPYVAIWMAVGHDPWHALRTALAYHHEIQDLARQLPRPRGGAANGMALATRSYATWLLWNPYDFALLLSPAVFGLAAAALFPVRAADDGPVGAGGIEAPLRPLRRAAFTWWLLLALLLVSGGVRGEAGRVWLIWMPFACLFAAAAASSRVGPHRTGRTVAWQGGVALVLVTEAVLTLTLAASMVFVSY